MTVSVPPACQWPWLLAALCLAVPLAADPNGWLPFLPPKEALLTAGAAIVAAAMMLSLWAYGWNNSRAHAKGALSTAPPGALPDLKLLGVVVIFWLWSVLAPCNGAVSTRLHMQGVIQLTALVVLGLAATWAAAADLRWRSRLSTVLALSGFCVALHALLQSAGLDPWTRSGFYLDAGLEGRWRLFTTIGNPNWTAAYLACTAPLIAWLTHQATVAFKHGTGKGAALCRRISRFIPVGRIAAPAVWIVLFAAIFAAGSRLAFLALIAGAVFWAWRARERTDPAYRTPPGSKVIAAIAAGMGAALLIIVLHTHGGTLLERWDAPGSIKSRLVHLMMAMHLTAHSPWTGNGLNNFAVAFPEAMPDVTVWIGPERQHWIPATPLAHVPNELFETMAASGVAAGLLLAMIWRLALGRALKADAPDGCGKGGSAADGPRLESALGAMLVAYAVLSLGWTPLRNPTTALPFWIAVGLLAVRPSIRPPEPSDITGNRGAWGRRIVFSLGLAATLIVGGLAIDRATNMHHANRTAAKAFAALRSGRPDLSEALFRQSLAHNPLSHETALFLAGLLLERHKPEEALWALQQAALSGASVESGLLQAQALRATGDADGALTVMQSAVKVFPRSLRGFYVLGDLHDHKGDSDAAIRAYARVIELPTHSPAAEMWRERARERLAPLRAWERTSGH